MLTSLFNYHLPQDLIAQTPITPRDHSRLFVYDRKNNKIKHDFFYNLNKYLKTGDCLVFNNSQVFPARLIMQKKTGGKVEVFLLRDLGKGKWECLIRGKVKLNYELKIMNYGKKSITSVNFLGKILKKTENGNWIIKFNITGKNFLNFLDKHAATPLPPYIKTADSKKIRQQYQTVYAKISGSAAAPTAGLHFTKKLLTTLEKTGIRTEFITLHVGLGTFRPVKTKNIEEHQMHAEYACLDHATAKHLNEVKKSGGRIIAVGTTTARVLETATNNLGKIKPLNDFINPFFYPSYKFKCLDGLISNFHLPESTLIMLLAAFLSNNKTKTWGIKKIQELYKEAIQKKYRFYSFGDAMLIL
ncbi:MAG TPA: tRNA preQ1(34) S-adenosylmethionine ribosyltransferase-isomerase QueA [bacterium]|nr:tRNA preQ1(34) S-adenosylmethionine ribosyltransferase-isomerase QueA [bacterium]